jgi:eukaryotic-like serine/threonine-protein kinase
VNIFKPGDSFYYFEVVRVISAGADGQVYEIRHRQTGDAFALKTMHAADCVDPRKTARALAGARGNYRIEHQNVVQVLDLNCEDSGLVWMRTELLRGYTLHEMLARQGRLSLPFALATAIEAAFGLHAVHEAQIIHRDVKPSNLFYTEGRAVKVLDLSLAKIFTEGLETTAGRRAGLGTPAYSAPEQLEGHARPDVRCDVYGLGITLWELLAGKNPFDDVLDDLTELLRRQLTVMPASLAEVAGLPPRVDEVVRRAIMKDPAERYSSMMEMARALMDLSAWVAAEARGRRLVVVVPNGEPPLPGDANTWRDYRPPEATPAHEAPAATPRERVMVAEPALAVAAGAMAVTEPVARSARSTGFGGTLPLDGRGVLACVPGPLRAQPAMRSARSTGFGGTLPLDDVSASMIPLPSRAPAPRLRRRTPWAVVIVAIIVASVGSAIVVARLVSHRAPAPPLEPTQRAQVQAEQ